MTFRRRCCQPGLSQGGRDGVFGVLEGDISGFDTESVHAQFFERQGESGGVLLRGVGRSDEDVGEVGGAVRRDIEIDERLIQYRLVHMEVPMVQKLHHIHRSHQFGRGYNGIVLRPCFGVNDKQSVGAKSETREGREEREVHRPYLMLGGDEPVRCLAGLHDPDPVDQGIDLIRHSEVPDDANILWVSHGNTLLSLMERFGQGKYDLTVRPENGSLTKLILTDDDVEVEYYNRK